MLLSRNLTFSGWRGDGLTKETFDGVSCFEKRVAFFVSGTVFRTADVHFKKTDLDVKVVFFHY